MIDDEPTGEEGELSSGEHEAKDHELPEWIPAGFWLRFFAWLYDSAIVVVVSGVLLVLFGGLLTKLAGISQADLTEAQSTPWFFMSGMVGLIMVFFSIFPTLFYLMYFAVFESSRAATTIGKAIFGIIVTDLDGENLDFGQSFKRNFLKLAGLFLPIATSVVAIIFLFIPVLNIVAAFLVPISFVVGILLFIVGHLMAAFTSNRQALHDQWARCLVLKSTKVSFTRRFIAALIALTLFIAIPIASELQGNFFQRKISFSSGHSSTQYREINIETPEATFDPSATPEQYEIPEEAEETRERSEKVAARFSLLNGSLSLDHAFTRIDETGRRLEIALSKEELPAEVKENLGYLESFEFLSDQDMESSKIGALLILNFGPFDPDCSKLSLRTYVLRLNLGESGLLIPDDKESIEFGRLMSMADAEDVEHLSCVREVGSLLELEITSKAIALLEQGREELTWDIELVSKIS